MSYSANLILFFLPPTVCARPHYFTRQLSTRSEPYRPNLQVMFFLFTVYKEDAMDGFLKIDF